MARITSVQTCEIVSNSQKTNIHIYYDLELVITIVALFYSMYIENFINFVAL